MKKTLFSYLGARLFAFLIVVLLVFSGCSKATQKAAAPAEEETGIFLTIKNLPQFGGKEFFGILPTEVLGVLATTGVDSLAVLADTVRLIPQKNGNVLMYADRNAPTSSLTYGPDIKGRYVLMGRPSAIKGAPPTFTFEGKEYYLLAGGEGIVIDPRGSTRILPGWKTKPDPPKKN